MPAVGENAVLHVWERRDAMLKGIAVGKKPWSPRGEKYGRNMIDGRLVMQSDVTDRNVDMVLLSMLESVVHLNPDTELASQGATAIMVMRESGLASVGQKRVCPTCKQEYDSAQAVRKFHPTTRFRWATYSGSAESVAWTATRPCHFCYTAVKEELKLVEQGALSLSGKQKTADELVGLTFNDAAVMVALVGGASKLSAYYMEIDKTLAEIGRG